MNAAIRRSSRWRLRFSLRTLFLLIAAGSMLLGVWVRSVDQQRRAVAAIRDTGGLVEYDFQLKGDGTPPLTWLSNLLGTDYLASPVAVRLSPSATDEELRHSGALSGLELLIGDRSTAVTDSGLEHLSKLTRLRVLTLSHMQVSDASLSYLKPLANLELLSLNGTDITDSGLAHLRHLKKLQKCELMETKVSTEGCRRLQRALPGCKVYWDGWRE